MTDNCAPFLETFYGVRVVACTHCGDIIPQVDPIIGNCTLALHSRDNEIPNEKLTEFRHGPVGFDFGKGRLHVDGTIGVTTQSELRL